MLFFLLRLLFLLTPSRVIRRTASPETTPGRGRRFMDGRICSHILSPKLMR